MTKNVEQFREFLRDEVNLNPRRLKRLNTSVGAVDRYLREHLPGYQNMERQGSYALDTPIKPVDDNDEYDADIQVVMNPNGQRTAKHYLDAVYETLKQNGNYADKLSRKSRCVRIEYAGDFHIDVVARVTSRGRVRICNGDTNKFEPTDGNGYREWFNEKNRITDGNLKRVVRLLKYLRDHKNNYRVKSILLTTLAANTIRKSDKGTEGVSTVADTLATVLTRMDDYLQRHPDMPEVRNPALPSETFNRHWDEKGYANFRNRVHSHALTGKQARGESSIEDAIRVWQGLFGDSFGRGYKGGGGGGPGGSPNPPNKPRQGDRRSVPPAASIPVAHRPSEARRFG